MNRNPLLASLRNLAIPAAKVPPGYKSTTQWAKEWSVGRLVAGRYIAAGVANGLMECKQFRTQRVDGHPAMAPFYREVSRR